MKSLLTALLLATCILSSCTSGGSDDDSSDGGSGSDLSRNACSAIGLQARIINGTECVEASSSVVELNIVDSAGRAGICSGTMISNDDMLTAAHCFLGGGRAVAVRVSDQFIPVRSVSVHPDFVFNDVEAFNDVAIVRLSRSAGVPSLPLLLSSSLERGDAFSIYGYGIDENGDIGSLRSGQMQASRVSRQIIEAKYEGPGSNTCVGDSGGPAVLQSGSGTGIVGVLSYGLAVDCGTGDISAFTNIQDSKVVNFIFESVPDANVS